MMKSCLRYRPIKDKVCFSSFKKYLFLKYLFTEKTNDSGYVTIHREDQELKDAAGLYFQLQPQQVQTRRKDKIKI